MIDTITAEVAREGANALVFDSERVRFTDDAPEWVRDAVYGAHNDAMPNDWVFDTARDAFDRIAESEDRDEDEVSAEFADEADAYNSDLLKWVSDYPAATGFIDEAKDEFGDARDFYHGIQMGQYLARSMIFGLILESVTNEVAEREDALNPEVDE